MAMERSVNEEIILQALALCVSKGGWVNLADLGTQLRKAGVRYGKLSNFLAQFPDLLEMKIDSAVVPPAVYVRQKPEE